MNHTFRVNLNKMYFVIFISTKLLILQCTYVHSTAVLMTWNSEHHSLLTMYILFTVHCSLSMLHRHLRGLNAKNTKAGLVGRTSGQADKPPTREAWPGNIGLRHHMPLYAPFSTVYAECTSLCTVTLQLNELDPPEWLHAICSDADGVGLKGPAGSFWSALHWIWWDA